MILFINTNVINARSSLNIQAIKDQHIHIYSYYSCPLSGLPPPLPPPQRAGFYTDCKDADLIKLHVRGRLPGHC